MRAGCGVTTGTLSARNIQFNVTTLGVTTSRRNRRQRKPGQRSLKRRGMRSARQRNGNLPQVKRRGFSPRRNWKPRKNDLHTAGNGKRKGGRNAKPQSRPSRLRKNP